MIHLTLTPGILSGLLIATLKTANSDFLPWLSELTFSPSFYMPHNLLHFPGLDFIHLAASLNNVKAWTLLPQYSERCQEYFTQPRAKNEYLLYTKALLERGDQEAAKQLLSKTLQFKWPETYRYRSYHNPDKPVLLHNNLRLMSRLTMTSDPQQSLIYASTATQLGDTEAPCLQASLLDHGGAVSSTTMGRDRLRTISQLIAKIDAVFAFNAPTSNQLRECGFIKFITGILFTSLSLFLIS